MSRAQRKRLVLKENFKQSTIVHRPKIRTKVPISHNRNPNKPHKQSEDRQHLAQWDHLNPVSEPSE